MLYNLLESKKYMHTAGKITIATALAGILIFAFVFLFNAGKTELMKVEAQTATTTLTVLNTPPVWVATSTELIESSDDNPTNSGDNITWVAVANDPNQPNYYLLICSTSATPSSTNSGAPHCNGGVQWGVSAPTPVNTQASVSTTTTESAPFSQSNNWFAWICDDDAYNARCNAAYTNGTNATNSSPFIVNYRPVFDDFDNDSPKEPSQTVAFTSSSTDPDGDTMTLIVCSTNVFSTSTNTCGGNTLATTTIAVASNPGANYVLPAIMRDTFYDAYGFIIDVFGHEAQGAGQGFNSQVEVSNVAPTVESIMVNDGNNIVPDEPLGEKTGLELTFTTRDANSCRTSVDALEIVNFGLALYQDPLKSTSTCDVFDGGTYDPNSCYTSAVASTTWNLSCTASTTSCDLGGSDATMDWSCTFPVWYVMNPNDAGSYFYDHAWRAGVAGIDDDNATGTIFASVATTTVESVAGIELLTAAIPYGQLEPGQDSGFLNASTTARPTGNTGIDHLIEGESMCRTFSIGNDCPVSASSTIPDDQQQFSTSSVSYGDGLILSSSTAQRLEIGIKKSTSTIEASQGRTYWGIAVPSDITLAGAYTGLNTISVVVSATSTWY